MGFSDRLLAQMHLHRGVWPIHCTNPRLDDWNADVDMRCGSWPARWGAVAVIPILTAGVFCCLRAA